jgi:hypothetical protein
MNMDSYKSDANTSKCVFNDFLKVCNSGWVYYVNIMLGLSTVWGNIFEIHIYGITCTSIWLPLHCINTFCYYFVIINSDKNWDETHGVC